MASWNALAQELKDMIFGYMDLIADEDRAATGGASHTRSTLATISKEFQYYFESKNFRSLTLSYLDVKSIDYREYRQIFGVRAMW
ncbi:hypothetical protein GGR57DRAFT_469902 [Xylariaceae sp. FL1272]|nr:hypothetical protein GGR57DRAFT_469902 [Xylariaceae sp. FL1272]